MSLLQEINHLLEFLPCETPQQWLDAALDNLPILLLDHAQCEKKAATMAMSLIHRYPDKLDLISKMSPLAREELLHFEKVLVLLKSRGVAYQNITPSRYAASLHQHIRKQGIDKFMDLLIIGAIIEARSCERFAALIPYLDEELSRFYHSLVKSEARHFEDYLKLAKSYAKTDIGARIEYFLAIEKELITTVDDEFRFHSGIPAAA